MLGGMGLKFVSPNSLQDGCAFLTGQMSIRQSCHPEQHEMRMQLQTVPSQWCLGLRILCSKIEKLFYSYVLLNVPIMLFKRSQLFFYCAHIN